MSGTRPEPRPREHGTVTASPIFSTMATVLLVEDNADVREMMATALELDGHSVLKATNGHDALRLLRDGGRPTLILLDLMMPVMDGISFLAALDHDATIPRTPVVVISAAGQNLLEQVRAAAYVPKPIDIDQLLAVVGQHSARTADL